MAETAQSLNTELSSANKDVGAGETAHWVSASMTEWGPGFRSPESIKARHNGMHL